MKQAAIMNSLSHAASRLANVRKRTWVFIGLGVLAFMAIMAWAAIALLMWAWGQVPAVAESGRHLAGAAMEKVGQAVPELKTQLDPWIGGRASEPARQAMAGDWPLRDVSGAELPGINRYPGFVRTHYVRAERRIELRYLGQGDFQKVLDHYVSQLQASGYQQEVLSASPEAETHRFVKSSVNLNLEIRRAGTEGRIEVVLVEVIR